MAPGPLVLDTTLDGIALPEVGAAAQRAESNGAGAAWIGELNGDPFLPMLLAAEHTSTLAVGTAVAIAFARSPMTVAMTAHELQHFSRGRFILGLGTQVRGHVTRRFSMPWSSPAARMREYVQALHAIWAAWQDGSELAFEGSFYTHTLMPPLFRPPPHEYERPKVIVAGVGELMVQVAGEVGDGLFVHPFTSPIYVRDHVLPALEAGAKASGRTRADLTVASALLTATGQTDDAIATATEHVRRQIAFYASTPAYTTVLQTHGWPDLQPVLAALVKQGRWEELGDLVTDEVLGTFALIGPPSDIARQLVERWGGVLDRVSLVAPIGVDERSWVQIHGELSRVRAVVA